MSVKKLLTIAAAGVVTTSVAFAGGAANFGMAKKAAPMSNAGAGNFAPTAYVEVRGGLDWSGLESLNSTYKWKTMSGNPVVVGLDAGYNFMPHFAAELGGTFALEMKGKGTTNTNKINFHDIYAALKVSHKVYPGVCGYVKAGVDYASFKSAGAGLYSKAATVNQIAPTFGAGVEFVVYPQWSVNVDYRHVFANTKKTTSTGKLGSVVPGQDLFTVGVGYTFNA